MAIQMEKLDMENRDPNDINDHLKVAFEDVLAEPRGAESNECTWNLAYCCYRGSKLCLYRCLTLLCGWWMGLCWGLGFACLTFEHIWCCTPGLKMYQINCGMAQKFYQTCVQCYLAPLCEVYGLCLSQIRIHHTGKE